MTLGTSRPFPVPVNRNHSDHSDPYNCQDNTLRYAISDGEKSQTSVINGK